MYITVWGSRNLGSKTPLNGPYFGLKIRPKLKDWFLQLRGAFSSIGTAKIDKQTKNRFLSTSH